jgi:putative DNA primase/helicase
VVPYLAKKRLQWENGLRMYTDGTLLVPMVRYDVDEEQDADPAYTGPRRLAGLQKIKPDGFKLFNKGMDPVGAACRFGRKPKDGDLLLVGEGLATVLSVHQGLERAYTCYVAFVAGNLERIGRMLREQYPKSPILFLADDDAYLEAQLNKRLRSEYGVHELYKVLDNERTLESKFGPLTCAPTCTRMPTARVLTVGITVREQLRTLILKNTGRTKAREAAKAIGNAWVAHPVFRERELKVDPEAPRLTDWNDLHVADGIAAVVDQVGAAIKAIEDAHELAQALAGGRAGRPAESRWRGRRQGRRRRARLAAARQPDPALHARRALGERVGRRARLPLEDRAHAAFVRLQGREHVARERRVHERSTRASWCSTRPARRTRRPRSTSSAAWR